MHIAQLPVATFVSLQIPGHLHRCVTSRYQLCVVVQLYPQCLVYKLRLAPKDREESELECMWTWVWMAQIHVLPWRVDQLIKYTRVQTVSSRTVPCPGWWLLALQAQVGWWELFLTEPSVAGFMLRKWQTRMGNETEHRNGRKALESNRAAGEKRRESGRKQCSESRETRWRWPWGLLVGGHRDHTTASSGPTRWYLVSCVMFPTHTEDERGYEQKHQQSAHEPLVPGFQRAADR